MSHLFRALSLPALLMAAGCGNDSKFTQSAKCDGVLQPTEDAVDEPFDRDGDGYFDGSNPGCEETYPADQLDCNDAEATIYPGNTETVCNDQDDDCDESTVDVEDADGDRFTSCEECDDSNASINPSLPEVACNSLDDDCDEATPDGPDADVDGYTACEDCDEALSVVNPGALEVLCNDRDDDCNEATADGYDLDEDGWMDCEGQDCDDSEETVNPGSDEVCDDVIDNDCDDQIDEACDSDYTGTWDLDDRVRYTCAFGLVSINFSAVFIEDEYPDITVNSTGTGAAPGAMDGSFSTSTTWAVERTITGTCDEVYEMEGVFTDENTFSGTFTASFVGGSACYDCTDQSWTVTGTR